MSQHAYLEVKPESEVTDAFDRIIGESRLEAMMRNI